MKAQALTHHNYITLNVGQSIHEKEIAQVY